MQKETVSFKLEKSYREALEKEAQKKEWTLSYYVQSIINQHVKKNKLVKI
jgi:predicted DNA-binding protein